MNVLMVASEAAPFLRTGGPADVVSDLTLQLRRQIPLNDARLIIPHYRNLNLTEPERASLRCVVSSLRVPLGAYERRADIWRLDRPHEGYTPLPVYLVKDEFYFGRENAYGYLDDYERFIFFTRAVIEMLRASEFASESWKPEVINGHDWIAGLIPFWLRHTYREDANLAGTAFVYTLHNAGFPGQFGRRALAVAELEQLGIYGKLGETAGRINVMARGILAADAVNTVSPTHAQEVTHQTAVPGLRGALEMSGTSLTGILNGLDLTRYDPALDDKIASQFNVYNLHRRAKNKRQLQEHEKCRLEVRPDAPLLGTVCRLISDKGVGLLREVLKQLVTEDGVQLVLLATPGDYEFREAFEAAEAAHPGQVAVIFGYDEEVARLIYAGSDIVLVPSRREPCGLSQMIAMRYGAVPVVRKTGGLADTVQPWDGPAKLGKGFLFESFDASAFLQAVRQALQFYRTRQAQWRQLQEYNLGVDFSWKQPVSEYERLYSIACETAVTRGYLSTGEVIAAPRDAMLVEAVLMANQQATITVSEGEDDADSLKHYLKQVARSVRELLRSDAVLLWTSDSSTPHTLQIGETSFARDNQTAPSEAELQSCRFRSAEAARTWSQDYIYRLDAGSDSLRGQSGFLNSGVATKMGWNVQLSVPVIAQGATLGQIDVFYRDASRVFDEWERGAVEAIANTVAVNFERTGLVQRNTRLLTADRKMSEVESVDDVAKVLLREARLLTHGDDAWLDLEGGPSYGLDSVNRLTAIPFPRDRTEAPGQVIRADLREDADPSVGVIGVRKGAPRVFSREDETTLACLARQAAGLVRIAQQRQHRDKGRVEQLEKLVASLVAGGDFRKSLELVVDTAAAVVGAQAASLYLINESTPVPQVELQAAAGYQKPLMGKGAVYRLGEGMTGWIAQTGKRERADTLELLRQHPAHKGMYDHDWGGKPPRCFLGVPLKVVDPANPGGKVIGVLKVEDVTQSEKHPEPHFTDQDELLVTMMANVIATVAYNAQQSEKRLRDLSASLQELSDVLAGSRDMPTLIDNIVKRIAKVLRVTAASLYLADEGGTELIIQAAAGYQEPLVKEHVKYKWGQGVTGTIAAMKKAVVAQSLEELRQIGGGAGSGTYDDFHIGHLQPQSFYGLPLVVKESEKAIGVLKVESTQARFFSSEDVLLIEMMANVIATVVYNAQQSEKRLRDFSVNLQELSSILAGSRDMPTLMDTIVKRIAKVLRVDAASLYLADEQGTELVIQAAAGYQEPLVKERVKYKWGQGVTGTIAAMKKAVVTQSLDELRQIGGGAASGTYDGFHSGHQQPQSFYGLPLVVKESEKAIGVLKVESTQARFFSSEDVLLIEMMANVIATVVYNAQQSEKRLRELSANLQELSDVLAGSRDMPTLMDNIVKRIAKVLRVDAASLYLADERGTELVIQAAAGYQEPLVKERVKYKWGQGVTGTIAAMKKAVVTQSLDELRQIGGGAASGTYDGFHSGHQQPQSFYGLPLVVKESEKAIGVLKVESTQARFFSSEDVLLIEMMANVIASFLYNMRQGETRLGLFLQRLGRLSATSTSVPEVLKSCVQSEDRGLMDQVALSLANQLDREPGAVVEEMELLFQSGAKPELYCRIADCARNPVVKDHFALYHTLFASGRQFDSWADVQHSARPWLALRSSVGQSTAFREAAQQLAKALADATRLETVAKASDANTKWVGAIIATEKLFGRSITRLPVILHRSGGLGRHELDALIFFAEQEIQPASNKLLLVQWPEIWSRHEIQEAKLYLANRSIEIVVANTTELIRIMHSPDAGKALRALVLRGTKTISPFVITGPVPDRMFFGRHHELGQIVEKLEAEHSCALVGGRRIGKTSILLRLHRVWLPKRDFCSVYLDCSTIDRSVTDMRTALECMPISHVSPKDFDPGAKNLEELFRRSLHSKPLVVLLDEADKLVELELGSSWSFFNCLRERINLGTMSVVLCGESVLREGLRDSGRASFNLADLVLLGPLAFDDVEALVTGPFKELEIELSDSRVVREIYELTGGHPNVVQRLCERLVALLNKYESRRVTLDHVQEVATGPVFLSDDYLQTYWEAASALERFISLLFVKHSDLRLLNDLQTILLKEWHMEIPIPKTLAALERLVDLRSILKKSAAGYEFALPAFPRLLRQTITVEEQLLSLKEQITKKPQ